MPTEWREGKEKFERGHVGDDQLLRSTQECGIFFKGTQIKASKNEEATDCGVETEKKLVTLISEKEQEGSGTGSIV